jgi:hypothetical protein
MADKQARPKATRPFWPCHVHYATIEFKPGFVKGKVRGEMQNAECRMKKRF